MAAVVKGADAEARRSQPLAKVEPLEDKEGKAVIEAILALRDSGRTKPVTQAEIRAWIDEGRE